jgi:hypothetical protein
VNPVCTGEVLEVEVAVTNVGVGHNLPAGPAGRRLVLEVAARGPRGVTLSSRSGPRLVPAAGGSPPSVARVFASGSGSSADPSPWHGPLAPFATDVITSRFAAPDGGSAEITARLVLVTTHGDPVEIASVTSTCPDLGDTP